MTTATIATQAEEPLVAPGPEPSYADLVAQAATLQAQLADMQAAIIKRAEERRALMAANADRLLATVKAAIAEQVWPDQDIYPLQITITADSTSIQIGTTKDGSRRQGHKVAYQGVEYPSARALADHLGLTQHLKSAFSAVRLLRDKKVNFTAVD